jgi:predicted RNA-binding protein with TRAM domain
MSRVISNISDFYTRTSFPKPVETGKEYTVDIIGIGRSGDVLQEYGAL